MKLSLSYLSALTRVVPPRDLARAALRRFRPAPPPPAIPGRRQMERAAAALASPPRLFSSDDPAPLYRAHFPEAVERFRRRARRILDGEAEIFGVWRRPDLDHPDPKIAWEAQRGGHLVELAAAARLEPTLPARQWLATQIHQQLDAARPAPPLEVALRNLHWLAALELLGGIPGGLQQRLARSLLMEGDFLSRNLEDGGVCPANHLLGDYLGLLVIGLWTGRRRWSARALAGVRAEAERQVAADGAHFEASTAYHRFALELLWIAHRLGAGLEGVLGRMLAFVRGYSAPDGSEPGFGDGDDARLLPLVPRAPRDHAYLLGLGAALLGSSRQGEMPEEVVWWGGAGGVRAWRAAAEAPREPAASFPNGGVHVLRSPRLYVAMRAGSYGQHGVGGHAHNDQLSLVVHLDGKPLFIDPGTGSYTADPVARERFRGTAAHSTVIVAGEEQSPFVGRPFALPDRARTGPVRVDDLGRTASLSALHRGYERLGVRHRRRVTLDREGELLLIEDELEGRGETAVEVRFQLAGEARIEGDTVVLEGARLLRMSGNPLRPRLITGWNSLCFSGILQSRVVSYEGLLSLPYTVQLAVKAS